MHSRTGIAIIGVGMVARVYAPALADLSERVHLTGVLGGHRNSGVAFLEQHREAFREARLYGSVAEIASDPDVDAVILATPPNQRTEIVEVLAAAGKPILMEKPIERTLKAAQSVVAICEREGVPLGIMLQHRVRPSARALADRMAAADFGPLNLVEISVPWWRDQGYYDEPGRGSYDRDGGGVMISQAIHTLDLALQFAGPVTRLTAHAATTRFHRMEAEDTVTAGLEFENGAIGTLFASTAAHPGRAEEIRLHYQRASVRLQSALLEIHHHDDEVEQIGASTASGAGADPMAFSSDWHRDVIADFLNVLRTGRDPVASGRSALSVHALIDALERSARAGQRIDLENRHDA